MSMTTQGRRTAALALTADQALHVIVRGEYAIYLRRLETDRWAVLAGWRVMESFGRDWLSEGAVAGLEGVCHATRNYDFGSDFELALTYYVSCVTRLARGQAPGQARPAPGPRTLS